MPRTAKEKVLTPIQIAANASREAVKTAKDANGKNDNATTKKALEHARDRLTTAEKAENRERFVKLGQLRGNNVLSALDILSNCTNRQSYEFSEADIPKIFGPIETKMKTIRETFVANLKANDKGNVISGGISFE